MAPECFYGKFTVMSDIWSFGVTCWEIFTLARALPYVEMEDKEVIKNAIHPDGPLLLECPDCCDHATFQLMTTCWSLTPKKRPSFTILCSQLRSLAEKHRKSGY
jgi:serine/threonine protein kinase